MNHMTDCLSINAPEVTPNREDLPRHEMIHVPEPDIVSLLTFFYVALTVTHLRRP